METVAVRFKHDATLFNTITPTQQHISDGSHACMRMLSKIQITHFLLALCHYRAHSTGHMYHQFTHLLNWMLVAGIEVALCREDLPMMVLVHVPGRARHRESRA